MRLSSSSWTLADLRRVPLWLQLDPFISDRKGEFTLHMAKFARLEPDAFEPVPEIFPLVGERYYLIGEGDYEMRIKIESTTGKRQKTYYFKCV